MESAALMPLDNVSINCNEYYVMFITVEPGTETFFGKNLVSHCLKLKKIGKEGFCFTVDTPRDEFTEMYLKLDLKNKFILKHKHIKDFKDISKEEYWDIDKIDISNFPQVKYLGQKIKPKKS